MKVGVYFCRCGGIVGDKIDGEEIRRRLADVPDVAYFAPIELACGDDGKAQIVSDLKEKQPDRVVVIACSPREHEETFRGVLAQAGMNPFLMQLVNVREQVGWVTEDPRAATDKAYHLTRAAVARVGRHEPLEKAEVDVNVDTLIIGAGPAGLKAALTLAEAGRKVVLVEKGPVIGGLPGRYDEIFPKMECGPCLLEPIAAEVMHGPHAHNIELLLLSEVVGAAGSFGNFAIKIKQSPRYVDLATCVGCGMCFDPCPVSLPNPMNCNLSSRKAMDFAYFGTQPGIPFIEAEACLRMNGKDPSCEACKAACPVEGAVKLDDEARILERQVGAVLIAVGGAIYDAKKLPQLGYGKLRNVVTSLEFERMAAGSGPTGGEIRLPDGVPPERVAIVHCVGSLDEKHNPYCSGVCCMTALKFNKVLAHKLPAAQVTHYIKTIVVPGKEDFELYEQARKRPQSKFVTYQSMEELSAQEGSKGRVTVRQNGKSEDYDMVVLMPAVVPSEGTKQLGKLLEVGLDKYGFCEELHGRADPTKSKSRGVYLAGVCQAPMDLTRAVTQGGSAAGMVMSALVPGRKLEVEAIHAEVDAERCSGCRSCMAVCPYKAVVFDAEREVASVDAVRCLGCGTCVAACPSGVIKGKHFSNEQIFAEIEGILA